MVANAPGIDIRLFDATVYAPQISDAIVGMVGPATKGPLNEIGEFTDEGNFVNQYGRPAEGMLGPRAAVRYFLGGSSFKYVRVAGRNIASATLTLYAADGKTPILILTASSPGSWANGLLQVAVRHNGTASYDVLTFFDGQPAGDFLVLTNGTVVTKINRGSARMTARLAPGAGATFPAATTNATTGVLQRLAFAGGDDGAFAKTDSPYSSTSGVSGKRFHGKMDATGGSRVFFDILTVPASLAGKDRAYSTVGMPVVPGTFTLSVPVAAGGTIELSDNGNLSYASGGAGLGLLKPASGTHVGYIDYRTGAFGFKLTGGSLIAAAATVIKGIWVRANAESVGSTTPGVGEYAGNLSSGPVGVGYLAANKVVFTVPIDELVGTPGAGASNASSEATLKSLQGWLVPGTVVLTPAHDTSPVPAPVYDDGFGGFRTQPNGGGAPLTGAIDYRTGQWSVTWDPTGAAMPASGSLAATYDMQVVNMGGAQVAADTGTQVTNELCQPAAAGGGSAHTSADSGAQAIVGPIKPGTVRVDISDVGSAAYVAYDNGAGGWLTLPRGAPRAAAVTGTIDYDTGAWSITPGTIGAGATIKFSYVSEAGETAARRSLRGSTRELVANTTALAGETAGTTAGLSLARPASGNDFNGPAWLDHETGEFAIALELLPEGTNPPYSFDVADNGTITAVYVPATILGFGDATTTVFEGTIGGAPFRRQANRLMAFQAAQAASAGAGEAQVSFAALGNTDADDYWSQNAAASSDPDNELSFRTGVTSIQWTAAPSLDEAVFVVAEEIVLHFTAKKPGDLGNEREVLADGVYLQVDEDPTLDNTYRAQVLFDGGSVESFGQATSLAELVELINDETNGSDYVTATLTDAGGFIPPDVASAQTCGMNGAFTQADIIGAKVGQTYTGLQLFSNPDAVAINWVMVPGQWHRSVITALQTLCEKKGRRCMSIVPMPDFDDPFDARDFINGEYNAATPGGVARADIDVPFPPLAAIDSRQLATAIPWVQYYDQYAAEEVNEPPEGDIAELIGGTPAPWFPIAGGKRGKVRATSIRYSCSDDDRALLYGVVGSRTEVINPIIRKIGKGLMFYGQRTTQRRASVTDRINTNWTINVIMNALDQASVDFPFELNDPILWREIATTLNAVLKPVIERRGLIDAFVLVDGTTTTETDIDNLTCNARIFLKPQGAAEYINYDVVLTPTGADFADVTVAG